MKLDPLRNPGIILALALVASFSPARAEPAQARAPVSLPPVQYDRPYTGTLITVRLKTERELIVECNAAFLRGYALGCSFPNLMGGGCLVYLRTDDAIIAAGQDPKRVMRHELGHCNGWGGDHIGWR
jgi:hypothetical protein